VSEPGGTLPRSAWFLALIFFASLAAAQDIEHGRTLFEQCAACHALDGEKNEPGPHLKNLFGRKVAAVEEFMYSPPMRRKTFEWTPEKLDAFLADPQAIVPGNKMPFAGMPDAQDRKDLIAFLQQATR
jgi:cytochrome c